MNVGFLLWWQGDTMSYVLADNLIRSVRTHMPGVRIVQLTDGDSPAAHGVDEVKRVNWNVPFALWCAEYYASLEGDWLLIDTDCELQRDVRDVFNQPFDVALTNRAGTIPAGEEQHDAYQTMPYNIGVVFSRSPEFWRRVAAKVRTYPPDKQRWMGNQMAVADLIADGTALADLRIHELPGELYNYPPRSAEEDVTGKAIVHYKGKRKQYLVDRIRQAVKPTERPDTYVGPLRVFIGYDPRQPLAYHVAAHSILSRASCPVAITPLVLSQLPISRRGLTEFTYSRFLVPWLCGFRGRAIFLDADMLCRADIAELEKAAQATNAAVAVVQHAKRFEWPSVMVFDCARCGALSPQYIDNPNHALFDFAWAPSIGALPSGWNMLVGYDTPGPNDYLIHFTQGIPCWPETRTQDYADEWRAAYQALQHTVTFAQLMGASVHPLAHAQHHPNHSPESIPAG